MRHITKGIICLNLALALFGCSNRVQDYKRVRPEIFNASDYGIEIGYTTEDEIRNKYKVIESEDNGILYLDPRDPNFNNLPIEKAIVYIDEDKIAF